MLSKKSQYAFRALSYLVGKKNDGPVLISDIATEKKIPIKFLENILLELKKAEILDSKKGKGGGYFLNRDPALISLATIIRLVNGPIAMIPCVSINFSTFPDSPFTNSICASMTFTKNFVSVSAKISIFPCPVA